MSILNSIYPKVPIWLQNTFCTAYGLKQYYMRYGSHFKKTLQWLNESQWWSYDRLLDYQNSQIRNIIRFSYDNIPFYQTYFKKIGIEPDDIKTKEDLSMLPILSKQEVIEAGVALCNPFLSKRSLIRGKTSGTTGTPMSLYYTRKCMQTQWAVWWRHRGRFGMTIKNRSASFGNKLIAEYEQNKPPFWRENFAFNQTVFSNYHMKQEFMKYFVDKLDATPYDYYSGYPSSLYLLASYLKENKRHLKSPPKVIFTGAETLHEFQKKIISEYIAFPTDEYGAAEYSGNASKCEYDYYHIDMEFGAFEIVPVENISSEPGEITGKVVVTGFHNPAMPLIRYDMTDTATLLPDFECPCGRKSPVIKSFDGRADAYVVTADRRKVGRLGSLFLDMEWIREAQIIQERIGSIKILIVRRKEYNQEDLDLLFLRCKMRLGENIKIELEFAEKIPTSKSGKFRAVISKIE